MLLLRGDEGPVLALQYFPDGCRLAASGQSRLAFPSEGVARIWDLISGTEQAIFRGHSHVVRALAVSTDGQTLALGSDWGWVAICDPVTDGERQWISAYKGKVFALAMFPDGRTLVTAGTDLCSGVRLWDISSGRRRNDELPQKNGSVRLLALSPDGEMLAWDTCGQVRIYNLKKEQLFASLRHQEGKARAMAFTPDSRTLAVALTSPEGGSRINLFNISAKRHAGTIPVPHTMAGAVAFTPDGRFLASGHDDGQVSFWEATTGRLRTGFQWHESNITAMAFAPDGMTAAAGYQDGTVVVWDVDLW